MKTAYFTDFTGVKYKVLITHEYKDIDGRQMYKVTNVERELHDFIVRDNELENIKESNNDIF